MAHNFLDTPNLGWAIWRWDRFNMGPDWRCGPKLGIVPHLMVGPHFGGRSPFRGGRELIREWNPISWLGPIWNEKAFGIGTNLHTDPNSQECPIGWLGSIWGGDLIWGSGT